MGVFVFLPLVLPLTAWPIARLAEQHLHPRTATWLLTCVAVVLALCSTLCLTLLMIVGTAQVPGNPLPDGWSDPEVREAVPFAGVVGGAAIPALVAVVIACGHALWRHRRVRRDMESALAGMPASPVVVLSDPRPYAYALPGRRGAGRGRIVASTAMLDCLTGPERRVLFAHERAHLAGRHHRYLLLARLAARAQPLLRPLRTAVAHCAERWADEDAADVVGDRRLVARAVGRAALVSLDAPSPPLPALAAPGPVPRRVAALLDEGPPARSWPPAHMPTALAAWVAAGGAAVSTVSALNAATALVLILRAATPS
ncbi:M56 family metallopeptidase [Streptomyces radicis]|uniref:M56 family peptidase n=1 Tax=Streptomyces radicis TaxID=1750517 RepID=A0A3A9WT34_9ACTN|nr:M56 family metallopeptidase [Streptomyces radicis]RKN10936.1 M56 family peptidase [Streptomyces radicis]RKN25199.1 M56 family peptidase [Streptomyces radicis]